MPRCLVLSGGFAVNDRRHRHLDQQARRLGFADLRACLQALLDDGWSVPQQRATAHAAELGFDNVRAYLVDRLVTKAWTLTQVQGELGAAPATLRRLLDRFQIRRVAPTRGAEAGELRHEYAQVACCDRISGTHTPASPQAGHSACRADVLGKC